MNPEVTEKDDSILIMLPVFNDWDACEMLLIDLDHCLSPLKLAIEILIVDDASSIPINLKKIALSSFTAIKRVRILELRRNLGHQRAIAIGLACIEANFTCKAVIVMDGDGEDSPEDVVRLFQEFQKEECKKIIFARRHKRSESYLFKIGYQLYKTLYRLLTGHSIRFGNFSIIPYPILHRLVAVSELWNHYASGLLKARVPYREIKVTRSPRLTGSSKMNFISLLIHGLSAISVHADVVGVRLFILSFISILLAVIAISIVTLVRFSTNLAIPGWASFMVGILILALIQTSTLSFFFIFMILNARNNYSFIPCRDYVYFVLNIREI